MGLWFIPPASKQSLSGAGQYHRRDYYKKALNTVCNQESFLFVSCFCPLGTFGSTMHRLLQLKEPDILKTDSGYRISLSFSSNGEDYDNQSRVFNVYVI